MIANGRPARDALLLATLAQPLEPERAPFYMKGSSSGAPDGWYWQPNGAARPTYLGRNVVLAEQKLIEAHRAQAE